MRKLLSAIAMVVISTAFLVAHAGNENEASPIEARDDLAVATFAGGCFWCVESDFEKVPGVVEAVSGYTGGASDNPTYSQVSSGTSGHIEAVQVYYDPDVITYEGLLAVFWRMVNPTDGGGQFVDRGEQYTTAIFYHDDGQRLAAERSREALTATGRHQGEIITPIRPAGRFHEAEKYHQDYYEKSSWRYKLYRYGSGRDQYLERTWGDELQVDFAKYSPRQS